jgi:predicted DCC family thiol-disulfide oxidoreductase YuxK
LTIRLNQWLDRNGRVAPVPFQNSQVIRSIGLTRAECEKAAWAIEPNGNRHKGAAAVIAGLSWAVGIEEMVRLYYWAGFRQIADAAYDWVAANRSSLPGVRTYCEEHPDECGRG